MEGDAALRAFIDKLNGVDEGFLEEVALEAKPLVEAAVRATAAAGTDPYGKPWRVKKDGTRAMPNAAGAVVVEVAGDVLQIKVSGGYAIQNALGGDSRRQVIPSGDRPLPPAIVEALEEALRRVARRRFG